MNKTHRTDIAQSTQEAIGRNLKIAVRQIFESIMYRGVNGVDGADILDDDMNPATVPILSPEQLLERYNEILSAIKQTNIENRVYEYTDKDLFFFKEYFDRDSPNIFITVNQSAYYDQFEDGFYKLDLTQPRAIKTEAFGRELPRLEFDALMDEYCTSKGFNLRKGIGSYEFSFDASELMIEMKKNRQILCVSELTQVIRDIVDPLYLMMGSIAQKIDESNTRNVVATLSPEEIAFQKKYLTGVPPKYVIQITQEELEQEAFDIIFKQSLWTQIRVLKGYNAKNFIADAFLEVWKVIEDSYRIKFLRYQGDPDGAGVYPVIFLVNMDQDELTQNEYAESERIRKSTFSYQVREGIRSQLGKLFPAFSSKAS